VVLGVERLSSRLSLSVKFKKKTILEWFYVSTLNK